MSDSRSENTTLNSVELIGHPHLTPLLVSNSATVVSLTLQLVFLYISFIVSIKCLSTLSSLITSRFLLLWSCRRQPSYSRTSSKLSLFHLPFRCCLQHVYRVYGSSFFSKFILCISEHCFHSPIYFISHVHERKSSVIFDIYCLTFFCKLILSVLTPIPVGTLFLSKPCWALSPGLLPILMYIQVYVVTFTNNLNLLVHSFPSRKDFFYTKYQ